MTADYQQNHAKGRAAYETFWAAIQSVDVSGITAQPPSTVVATLTYHRKAGGTDVERTRFSLVQENGVWKIADSSVVGG